MGASEVITFQFEKNKVVNPELSIGRALQWVTL